MSTLKVDVATILSNYATKTDIAELRGEMHKMNASMRAWTLATVLSIIGTMLAAIFGISQIFKNSTPQQAVQPQPIVIYAQPAPAPQAPTTK